MKRKNIPIFCLLILALFLASCGQERPFFYKAEKIQSDYEYITDIVVVKRGFYFLWLIPFRFSSESAAKDLMKEETLGRYPDAVGMFEVKKTHEEGLGFFDWVPEVQMTGKIVKKASN